MSLFIDSYYLANNWDVADAVREGQFGSGWDHFTTFGYTEASRDLSMPEGFDTFNELFYLANNPEAAKAVEAGQYGSGWIHYNEVGQAAGLSFEQPEGYGDFNELNYLLNNPDVAMAVKAGLFGSGWHHYSTYGNAEPNRSYAEPAGYGDIAFNETLYLANNPDVARAVEAGEFGSGWHHYVTFGRDNDLAVRTWDQPDSIFVVAPADLATNEDAQDVAGSLMTQIDRVFYTTIEDANGIEDNADYTFSTVAGDLPTGFSVNPDGTYALELSDNTYQSLAQDAQLEVTVPFTVSDGVATRDGMLNVTIDGVNDLPEVTAPIVLASQAAGAFELDKAQVDPLILANVTDIDAGDQLTVSSISLDASQGTMADQGEGLYMVVPAANVTELVFDIIVSDGHGSIATTASMAIESGEETIEVLDGKAGASEYWGTDGAVDIFVFNYLSDTNGAFADFGQVTIHDYNLTDGDILRLVDGNGVWQDIQDFKAGGPIQANGGDCKMNFGDDPAVNGIADQHIILMGVTLDKAFGATLVDVNATFEFSI